MSEQFTKNTSHRITVLKIVIKMLSSLSEQNLTHQKMSGRILEITPLNCITYDEKLLQGNKWSQIYVHNVTLFKGQYNSHKYIGDYSIRVVSRNFLNFHKKLQDRIFAIFTSTNYVGNKNYTVVSNETFAIRFSRRKICSQNFHPLDYMVLSC